MISTCNSLVVGSEIILRPKGFCNLTEVVVRAEDTKKDIERKVEIATILGTFQSTVTNFRYLRKEWQRNAEEERLLGVSLTGVMDNTLMAGKDKGLPEFLEKIREQSVATNKEWAESLGINQSAAITTQKPSGTVSQLCNTASGIHPRFSEHYIRSVRADVKDPLATFMVDKGFPYEEDFYNKSNLVFYFPMKSPEASITADEMTALDQLNLWEIYQDHWCEHKPSMTCYYSDDEFLAVGDWVWNKFDKISGISFLPRVEHSYKQAPYQAVTKAEYEDFCKKMPKGVDWTELQQYEQTDNTEGSQTLACHGGQCEL